MFFDCATRSINVVVITVTFLVMGAIRGIEPVQTYLINQAINTEQEVSINMESGVYEWKLEIPKINLTANISDGTDEKTMNKYIGHFSETNRVNGNVGLAAHNRGYPVNYFKNLKDLQIGDKLYYSYLGKEREYIIDKIRIIKDTNWDPLKNTNENRITLITCIANEPEYRLCVQGIEIGGYNENKENNNFNNNNDDIGK